MFCRTEVGLRVLLFLCHWLCNCLWASCPNQTLLIHQRQDPHSLPALRTRQINFSPLTCVFVDSSGPSAGTVFHLHCSVHIANIHTTRRAAACTEPWHCCRCYNSCTKHSSFAPNPLLQQCAIYQNLLPLTQQKTPLPAFPAHNQTVNSHSSTRASIPELITH